MTAVFGDAGRHRRQLGHLVPVRLAALVARVERVRALAAGGRLKVDCHVDPVGGNQRAAVARMPRLRAARASALLAAPAQSRLAGQPIGRGRLGGRRRILEAQRELAFEVLDPLGLLGHFSFPFGELTAQPLNLLLQPFLSVPLLPLRARTPHVSDGTPIASTCTDPLNCYQFCIITSRTNRFVPSERMAHPIRRRVRRQCV